MSLRARPAHWLLGVACVLVAALTPSPASAAQRIESFLMPSTQGNVDIGPNSDVKLNKLDYLGVTVMLPDGYDEQPGKHWPVLFLLAGIGDNSTAWAAPGTGNIKGVAAGLPAIVVMPESGRGFSVDWWRGGARSGPSWSRYTLDEVLPTVESKYRILPGRQNHAIAGLSMGGYGALLLAGQLPSYFGSIVSMSGLVDSQSLDTYAALPSQTGAASYESVWGPIDRPYASVNNPMKVGSNVAESRVYLSTGNGVPNASYPFLAQAWTVGVAIETLVLQQTIRYNAVLDNVGAPHVLHIRGGVHDWPYWRRELPVAIKQWGLFNPPPVTDTAANKTWVYKTMQPHGNAWGIGFKFRAPTSKAITFERRGQVLRAYGGGDVTIAPGAADADATGNGSKPECSFEATVPFVRTLPAGC